MHRAHGRHAMAHKQVECLFSVFGGALTVLSDCDRGQGKLALLLPRHPVQMGCRERRFGKVENKIHKATPH